MGEERDMKMTAGWRRKYETTINQKPGLQIFTCYCGKKDEVRRQRRMKGKEEEKVVVVVVERKRISMMFQGGGGSGGGGKGGIWGCPKIILLIPTYVPCVPTCSPISEGTLPIDHGVCCSSSITDLMMKKSCPNTTCASFTYIWEELSSL
jgi:hypothetical protein